jgi:phosphatidylglycerol:prolipoprotein diacylglycerol transferase
MSFALAYPDIDPVLISIGPFAIRWYALAYIAGLLLGWWYVRRLVRRPPHAMTAEDVDDFLVWVTLGVVLGGRLGYVLFYNFPYFLHHPLAILRVWEGGMSFHGGVLGVVTAGALFVWRRGLAPLPVADVVAAAAPIGLFFGRIANFINGELFGRVVENPDAVPWAMVFPRGGPLPRHPSQIYEALLEGLVLFLVLYLLARRDSVRERPGTVCGAFLLGYGLARSFAELFRQPDAQIGFLAGGLTMGQLLSVPMILAGIYLVVRARRIAG